MSLSWKCIFLTKSVISYCSLNLLASILHPNFLTSTTLFFTVSLNLFKSTEASANLSISNFSGFLFKLTNLLGNFSNLSISNLPTSDFNSAKSAVLVKHDVSTPASFF